MAQLRSFSRRSLLRQAKAAGAVLLSRTALGAGPLRVAGEDVDIWLSPISEHTFRLSVLPIREGKPAAIPQDGSLVQNSWGTPTAKLRDAAAKRSIRCGALTVDFDPAALMFTVRNKAGARIQELKLNASDGALSFITGSAPLLGLGEGGPQFDRRGSVDTMRSGQGGYRLRTHGGRVPIPWIIGTDGWGMFIHQPYGTFDFTGSESRFQPLPAGPRLPLDLFFIASSEPATILSEYTRLTGNPEMPPVWSLGYQQSHRTLASREEILEEAKTFREKKLPCDTMIYLGTGFCPSGWNTDHGQFDFNKKVFPDPKAVIDALHADHFKVALHVVVRANSMRGTIKDACDASRPAEEQPSCYWNLHRDVFALGVDGWWPDEGDPMDVPSRLARNRMYWEGPQTDRPSERPFALHRNGYAGMQRYGSFLWSGDVYSTWETLRTHIPIAVNTGLTGIPFWGTDIGGFVPTKEFTGELYVRWFQFAAFCPLFRSHGRTWKLRLPWGWNTGDPGPVEVTNYNGAATPDPAELHNALVEPICKKYLELRYRMLPYLYSAIRESCRTGLPVMRALWLHYPDDPIAVARGDEYLWGRDFLVAPVVEQGATSRSVYLPRGVWHDFWTGERHDGGKEVTRRVELETTPLYLRAGAILPLGPVKQYVDEAVAGPLTIQIRPGADGSFLLYEDDGRSFDYRKGQWMGVRMAWNDARRTLSLRLESGSRMLAPLHRELEVRVGETVRTAAFDGKPLEIRL